MNEQSLIDEIAIRTGRSLRGVFCACDGGDAWLVAAASGPIRLTSIQWAKILDRVVKIGAEELQKKPPSLDAGARRRFASAAGILCLRRSDPLSGIACPECCERGLLAPIFGGATFAEAFAK